MAALLLIVSYMYKNFMSLTDAGIPTPMPTGFQDGLWSMKILTYHFQHQYLQSRQVKESFLLLQSVFAMFMQV